MAQGQMSFATAVILLVTPGKAALTAWPRLVIVAADRRHFVCGASLKCSRSHSASQRRAELAARIRQIIASGELEKLERVEATLCYPLPKFSYIRPISRRQAGGAFLAPRVLRISARRFRRGSAARRTGDHDTRRRGREHGRHRCDLSRRWPPTPRTQLNAPDALYRLPCLFPFTSAPLSAA